MSVYDCIHSALCYAQEIREASGRDLYGMRNYGDLLAKALQQALSELPPFPQSIPMGSPVDVEIVPDDAKLLAKAYAVLLPQQPEVAEGLRRLILRMIDTHPSLHPEAS